MNTLSFPKSYFNSDSTFLGYRLNSQDKKLLEIRPLSRPDFQKAQNISDIEPKMALSSKVFCHETLNRYPYGTVTVKLPILIFAFFLSIILSLKINLKPTEKNARFEMTQIHPK